MTRICGALLALAVVTTPACQQKPETAKGAAVANQAAAREKTAREKTARPVAPVQAGRPAPRSAARELPVTVAVAAPTPAAPAWAPEHPQPVRPAELFQALKLARVAGGEAADLVVSCQATAKGRFDSWSRPDISLRAILPGGGKVSARGPEDRNTAYIALRLPRIKKGDRLEISAYDRDATRNENIGSRRLTYDGAFPLEEGGPHLDLICRSVDRQGAQVLLKDEAKITERLLGQAGKKLTPAPGARGWGFSKSALPGLRNQLSAEAALVGWTDPVVVKHLGELAALQKKWDGLAVASVNKTAAALPPRDKAVMVKAASLSLRVSHFICTAEAGCLVKLWAKNEGDKKQRCSSVTSWLGKVRRQALVRADGSMVRLQIRGCMSLKDGGRLSSLEPGAEAIVLLGVKDKEEAKGLFAGQFKLLWLSDFMMRKPTLLSL